MWQVVSMRKPILLLELVDIIELVEVAYSHDTREGVQANPRRVIQERRAPESTQQPVDRLAP